MKNKALFFVLGGIAAVAGLAVYGYYQFREDILSACDDYDDDDYFEDDGIADEFNGDVDDSVCAGNCGECDLCNDGAADVIPDVSDISAGKSEG